MKTSPRFVIRKKASGIWIAAGLPWRMHCRSCGRRAHHGTWADAATHCILHQCNPWSIW